MISKSFGRKISLRYLENLVTIRGSEIPKDLNLPIRILVASFKNFYLTGSCSECRVVKPKDIDFFVRDSLILRKFLLLTGFKDISGDVYYDDSTICRIFRYESSKAKPGKISHIDIQFIRTDRMGAKVKAQKTFERLSRYISNAKDEKKAVWRILLEL